MATSLPEDDEGYKAQIDNWVSDLIRENRTDFDSLLLSLPGVYPTDVLDSLRRLVQAGRASSNVLARACSYVRQPPTRELSADRVDLPVPHPLDYAWRFSQTACEYLLGKCLRLSQPGETVVLLGAPSVCWWANENGFQRKTLLMDSDAVAVANLGHDRSDSCVVCCSLTRGGFPDARGSVIVADPPWYPEYMRSFLWAAAALVELKGHVLLCFPPTGTRPGIQREWHEVKRWAGRCGLSLVSIETGALPYVSPPFERNALSACGILTVPPEWRRADLAVFQAMQHSCEPSPPPPEDAEWRERRVQEVRIRVRRQSTSEFLNPSLVSIVPGDILPSVSRRDPRRRGVSVWTSGNRIFGCQGQAVLANILHAMASGQPPCEVVAEDLCRDLTSREKTLIGVTVSQVRRLVAQEAKELLLWG